MRSYETRLNELVDLELKNEVEKFKTFELLNSEKVTPYFVKMTNGNLFKNIKLVLIK